MRATYHSANSLRRALAFCARLRDAYDWSNSPKEVIPCLVRGLGFQQVVSAVVNARYSATDLWVGDPISRRAAMCGPLYFCAVVICEEFVSDGAHRTPLRFSTNNWWDQPLRHGVRRSACDARVRVHKDFCAADALARNL